MRSWAARPPPSRAARTGPPNFKGTVQEVAADGTYVVVDVTGGNKRARAHLGVQQFGVTPETKIEVNEEDADLSDLAQGDEVKVQSKAAKDATEFDARKISVEREVEVSLGS